MATERLGKAIAALSAGDAPCAVLRIGIDDLRAVNEATGHAIRDEILGLAEKRLQAAIREHEMVVRLPGDEFAVLLRCVGSVIRAGAAADRLNHLLQRVYLVHGEVVNLTACLGIALAPEDGVEAEILLQRAGLALQCARKAGTGTVQFFEPAMEENRKKRPGFSLYVQEAHLARESEWRYPVHVASDAHPALQRGKTASSAGPSVPAISRAS